MRLEQSFEVPVPVAQAWEVLLDLEQIAPCMPGATLTGFDGETFTGIVKVKLGPVSLAYRGNGRFLERDADAHRMSLVASGQDSRGAGGASARVSAVLHDARGGSATLVKVVTDIDIAGRAAQFGRGMIADVSGKLIKQFADCLAETIAASGVAPAAAAVSTAPVAAAVPVATGVPAAVDATAAPSSPAFAVPPVPAGPPAPPPPPPSAVPAPPAAPPAVPAPAAPAPAAPPAAPATPSSPPVTAAPPSPPPPTTPVFQEPVAPPPAPPAPPAPSPAEEYHPLALREPPTPVEPISPTPAPLPAPAVEPQPASAYAYEPPPPPPPLPAEQAGPGGVPTPAPPAQSVTPAGGPRPAPKENEPIDLLAISGAGSMLKRYAPLIGVVLLIIIALIVWAIV